MQIEDILELRDLPKPMQSGLSANVAPVRISYGRRLIMIEATGQLSALYFPEGSNEKDLALISYFPATGGINTIGSYDNIREHLGISPQGSGDNFKSSGHYFRQPGDINALEWLSQSADTDAKEAISKFLSNALGWYRNDPAFLFPQQHRLIFAIFDYKKHQESNNQGIRERGGYIRNTILKMAH